MGGASRPASANSKETMQFLRVCRSVLRELKLASPLDEGGAAQWRYIVSAVRQSAARADDAASKQREERLLSTYHTYLQSSRRYRVSYRASV